MKAFKAVLFAFVLMIAVLDLGTGWVGMFIEIQPPSASAQWGVNGIVAFLLAMFLMDDE